MATFMDLKEKYKRNGLPALPRPDRKPPEGWSLSLITAINRVRNHNLSPDGERIAFIWDREDLSDVYTMPVRGGWPARLSTNRGLVAYWDDEIPQWSPDSRWLAFGIGGHVHVALREGGLPQKITDFTESASSPVWMPDSRGLIVTAERRGADQLLLTDREGAWPRPLTDDPLGDHWDAHPSPDGRRLAFVFRPFDDLNRTDIHVLHLETGQTHTLAGAPKERNWSPRWAPDGEWLAFLSQRSGFNEAWLARPDGEGLHQLTRAGHDVGDLAWAPEGKRLACTVNREGAFDLAVVDAATGALTDLRIGLGYYSNPHWTPEGDALTVEYEDPLRPPDIYRVEVPSGISTPLTFSQLPALSRVPLAVPQRVGYRSFDGLEVPAFLYRPAQPNGAAVVYPHGGPSSLYPFGWDIFAQYLVAKGYTYLAPNYRGSTGYGVPFEHANYGDWGVGDAQDCLHGAKFLAGLPGIDPARLAIFGGSYGGYMVACCLSRDPEYLFACGVSKYGDAHLESSWALCNRHLRLYTEIFLGHPAKNRKVFEAGSPIHQVENVQKPVLIFHGLRDDVVPPQASEEWVEALRRAGKTFEYKTYASEPHGFLHRANLQDVYSRTERFLDWYLMV